VIGLVSLKDILEKICGQEMIDDDDHQFKTLLSVSIPPNKCSFFYRETSLKAILVKNQSLV